MTLVVEFLEQDWFMVFNSPFFWILADLKKMYVGTSVYENHEY